MNWTRVEAECNCPHSIESWCAYIYSSQDISLSSAKEQVETSVKEHVKRSEACSFDCVNVEVYFKDSVDVP